MREQTSTPRNVVRGLCLMGCVLSACGDSGNGDGSKGTLVVPFQLGNNRTCESLDVKTVRAELNEMTYVQEAPCGNFQVRFRDVPAGSYKLKMVAIDDNGIEVMDSYNAGDLTVNVTGNDATNVYMPTVQLTAAPAHLLVRWNFGFTSCMGVGIQDFVIEAWRGSGNDRLLDATLDCTLEGEGADQYREIDDPNRRFTGDDSGEVTVQPRDKSKAELGQPVVFKFKAPGPGQDVRVSLDCGDGACHGTGRPDPNN